MSAENKNAPSAVGNQVNQNEAARLTTGRGQYFANKTLPNMLHLVFVRSREAHARIVNIDKTAAENMPGVVAVITGEDLCKEIRPLPRQAGTSSHSIKYPEFWPLAVDKVKFHGEPVAAVIASDRYAAEDAAHSVAITYDPLPAVTDMEEALKPDVVIVHDGWDNNEMFAMTTTGGETEESQASHRQDIDDLLEKADVVIKRRFRVHRCGATPIEPRGALAQWDDDGLTVWTTTQSPHIDRLVVSDVLQISSDKVRVFAPHDQGNAFTSKATLYREPLLVCHMARKLNQPVRWLETRKEHLMSASQECDQIHDLEIGADKDGRIVALRDNIIADNGDGCQGNFGGFAAPFFGATSLTNAYDLPKCDIRIRVACTNKPGQSPTRSLSTFAARFALDRAIDIIARELQLDPVELRERNLIANFPHTTVTGLHHDNGDYIGVLEDLAEKVDLKSFRQKQAQARKQKRYLGIGFSVGAEPSETETPVLQFAAHAAIVEIDPKTGEFEIKRYVTSNDCNTETNPQLAEGQIHGGVAQGISNTLFEEFIYDKNGQQRTTSFETYRLANAADLPNIETTHDAATPCPQTSVGNHECGEGSSGPVPAALTNAVCDALAPFDIEINELPLRPFTIWQALEKERHRKAALRPISADRDGEVDKLSRIIKRRS